MVFSFFRRGTEHKALKHKVEKINSSISHSFKNIKDDMSHIGTWLGHFKGKHDDHEKQFNILLRRISRLESSVAALQDSMGEEELEQEEIEEEVEEAVENIEEQEGFGDSVWDTLTETQQKICWKLALLQKEVPDQWISLKYLAQELYPEKDYNQVRSTISQFIGALEELGFVKRRRKGKQAYVFSTKKNPCYGKKKKAESKIKTKE
jgi:chromosome segregation ATPase